MDGRWGGRRRGTRFERGKVRLVRRPVLGEMNSDSLSDGGGGRQGYRERGGEATGFGHLGIGRSGGGKDCVATLHVVASGHLARSGSLASQAGGAGIRGVLARRAASDGEITKKVNDDGGGGRCIAVWRSRSGVQRAHLCPLAKQWMTTSAPPHPHPRPRLLLPATARNIRWRGGQEFLSYFFHLLQRRSLRALPSLPRSARGR